MHGQQVAAGALSHPGGAADQCLALRTAGERDDDPLAGLPDVVDVVLGLVATQPLVDAVGEPEQRQLPQRGQVADPEVVAQGGVDPLGRVDVAVREAPPQRLRGHVHELDLVGAADDGVGHGFLLGDAGDLLDDVVEALQVLDVDGGQHMDAGVEDLVDVLPALGVLRAGHVGVCQLVDHHDLRPADQDRLDVELGQRDPAVGDLLPGQDLEALELLSGARPAVRLHQPNDDVGAPGRPPVRLPQHGEGLPDAGSGAEVDAQGPAGHAAHDRPLTVHPVTCRASRSRQDPSRPPARPAGHRRPARRPTRLRVPPPSRRWRVRRAAGGCRSSAGPSCVRVLGGSAGVRAAPAADTGDERDGQQAPQHDEQLIGHASINARRARGVDGLDAISTRSGRFLTPP